MRALRTPEERFADLPDYPYLPRYHVLPDGLRMHYVDEGHSGATAVLLLHGEPTWSYLYRKMISPIVKAGFRVLAPDLIGFGKSDKLTTVPEYTYQGHLEWLLDWIEALDLKEVTLFCQDWGSFLGLRLAMESEQRFSRIMLSNGFLPTVSNGFPPTARKPVGMALLLWRAFSRWSPWFPTGRIVRSGCVVKPRPEEIAAYDAPFPSEEYKAGPRAFPRLIPFDKNDPAVTGNRAAWERLSRWEKPFLCVFGENDPILGRLDRVFIAHVPGARDQRHERIWGGHFIQEDRGVELARRLVEFIRDVPVARNRALWA